MNTTTKSTLPKVIPHTELDQYRRRWINEYRQALATGQYRFQHFIQQKIINVLRRQFGAGFLAHGLFFLLLTAALSSAPLWITKIVGGSTPSWNTVIIIAGILFALELAIIWVSTHAWNAQLKQKRIKIATTLSVDTSFLFQDLKMQGFFDTISLAQNCDNEKLQKLIVTILKNIKNHFTLVLDKVDDVEEFSVTLFGYAEDDADSMVIIANTSQVPTTEKPNKRDTLAHYVAESGKDFALMDALRLPEQLFSRKTFDGSKIVVNRSKYLIPLNFDKPSGVKSEGKGSAGNGRICKGVLSISFRCPVEFYTTQSSDHQVVRHHIFLLKQLIESRKNGAQIIH